MYIAIQSLGVQSPSLWPPQTTIGGFKVLHDLPLQICLGKLHRKAPDGEVKTMVSAWGFVLQSLRFSPKNGSGAWHPATLLLPNLAGHSSN